MIGKKALLDSNILIYASKGLVNLESLLDVYDEYCISLITYMEVLGYHFREAEEKKIIENMMEQFTILPIDYSIAQIVIDVRRKKKMKLPDAIILATAEQHDLDLVTYNVNDFLGMSDKVSVFKPN